ncbi:hypothetical protein N9R79_03075 [Vibrio sp.]|nr:hypothetical protein [Vibrio sp.]
MKRNSNSYRLQMIKNIAHKKQQEHNPMAERIKHLLDDKTEDTESLKDHRFPDVHFDDSAGGWVSNKWGMK